MREILKFIYRYYS